MFIIWLLLNNFAERWNGRIFIYTRYLYSYQADALWHSPKLKLALWVLDNLPTVQASTHMLYIIIWRTYLVHIDYTHITKAKVFKSKHLHSCKIFFIFFPKSEFLLRKMSTKPSYKLILSASIVDKGLFQKDDFNWTVTQSQKYRICNLRFTFVDFFVYRGLKWVHSSKILWLNFCFLFFVKSIVLAYKVYVGMNSTRDKNE